MTDISQVKTMAVVAQMDASNYEAGARKVDAANKLMASSEKQAQTGAENFGRVIAVTERSLLALESRLGGVSKASADLARAETQLAKAQETAAAAVDAGSASQERANRIVADATKLVAQKKAALQSAVEVERVAELQATAHATAVSKVTASYQQQLAISTQLQGRSSAFGLGTSDSVGAAYKASVAPIDMATAAVRRNYQASTQAGSAQVEELSTRLKVKQAYEASLNPVAQLTNATKGHADATKLSAFQLHQLSFQMNDVVSGLAMGQRPMQILTQQGGQIAQSFGGVGAMFSIIRAQIAAIGAPILGTAAAVGSLAIAFGLGIVRATELDHQLKALKTTLASTGGATGISAGDLQTAANNFARQPGVSRDTAIQAAQGLAANPLINADLLTRALPTVRDFAAATGKDIPEAAKAMATALTGGYSAAKQLDAQFHLLSVSELDQIKNLEEQGRKGEAANIVLAAMQRQWKDLADNGLTESAKAANSFGNAWDVLMDKLGKSGPITFARDRLIDLLRAAGGQTDTRTTTTMTGLGASGPIGQGIVAAIAALGLAGSPASASPGAASGGSLVGGLVAVQQAAGPATAALTSFNAAAAAGKGHAHDLALEADAISKGLDPAGRQMQLLANQQALLTTAMANGKITAEEYAKSMALLGIAMQQVQTPANILDQLTRDQARAGMGPYAGAGFDAAERVRLAGGTQDEQDEARRRGAAIYGAGQGQALGQQIGGMQQTVGSADAVVAAYAKSTEAGRRAELQLKALEAQWENGAEAVKAYADALIKQDAAQRRIEGARDVAKLKDDVADLEKLTAALKESTIAYERQAIANDAANKVKQGYLSPAQGLEYQAAQLAKRQGGITQDAINLSRTSSPQLQLADNMARLNEQMASGALTQDAYNLKVREYNDLANEQKDRLSDLDSGFGALADGITSSARAYARSNTDFKLGQQIFEGSVNIMSDALSNFAATGELSFRRIASSFASMLAEMAAKKASSGLMDILGSIFESVVGSIAGGIGGGFSSMTGFDAGAVIPLRASGGPVTAGMPYVVGEREAELFVPDTSGTVYNQRQMAAMGGGDVHVTQVFNFGASGDRMITRADMVQWGREVEARTKASMVDMKRRGALRGSF